MTRQMADDEVLRPEVVAALTHTEIDLTTVEVGPAGSPLVLGIGWHDLITLASHNAAVAALQAERDALRKHSDQLAGERFSERNHTALQSRAERAESALEALRGQVAGLVEKWRLEIEEYDAQNVGSSDPEDWMSGHRECLGELLAIKERMG